MNESVSSATTNGTSKGKGGTPLLPELPHITNNIVLLSNVLRFHTQEAYKQLSRLIENLANTRTSESDVSRKRKFLELIISLRQDFIKIYTLVKWAQNSKDVSKLIDILNWLRTQEFYFDNLGYGLNELNNFSGAKLPNSDILTSLEVLVKGRPQLPSYNFIERQKISPERILEVLRDLNLTLVARMALIDDMSPRFQKNYVVRDGRVTITIPNEFEVSITVANDLIVENEEDYYKSPFFFIDFAFLFGINPESSLITHRDSNIITRLPKTSREKLEAVVNQVLLKQSLKGLYSLLHEYAVSFKLYLISKQLKDLSVNSKWRNNIQFKYNTSLIIINYWSNHYLSRNWKSFIEIGIDKQYNLNFRWFKNGKYNFNHDIQDISGADSDTGEPADLSVDFILNLVINKHSEMLISKIFKQLQEMTTDFVSYNNPYQLSIKLTPKRTTILAINPLTGFFYFMDPSLIESQCQNRINNQPSQVKNRSFISEQDMVVNVVSNLVQLRLDTFNRSLSTKLITTEWISNNIIKLNDYETAKLFNFILDEKTMTHNTILFYRCRTWPSSWFLINMISGLTSNTYWWVARLKSIKGEWKIQWVQMLKAGEEQDFDYKFFTNLSKSCSNMIVDHMITEELQKRSIQFVKVTNHSVLTRFNIPHTLRNTVSDHQTVIALHNTGNLLPVSVTSNTLFLVVQLVSENNSSKLNLTICGNFSSGSQADEETFAKLNVKINPDTQTFEFLNSMDLSSKSIENGESNTAHNLVNQLLSTVEKVNTLIQMLNQLKKTDIRVTNNSFSEITFDVDPLYKHFHLNLPANDLAALTLAPSEDEDQLVKLITKFLSQQMNESHTALVGTIEYLKQYVPIFKTIGVLKEILKDISKERLPNELRRLQLELKFSNLNCVQFLFYINLLGAPNSKKVHMDKIVFSLSFKRNKFDKAKRLLLKVSLKENLNSENLKYKKLFEDIFRAATELQQEKPKGTVFVKLNYDFLMDPDMLEPLMRKVTDCFLRFLKT